jgi:DNA-binding transcriptional LysR family regulator
MSNLQRRIRLTQLRLLVAIAEKGSLARAAQSMHVTQPAATKTLRQLELAVGENLVSRGAGGSLLSPSGQLLYRRARLILAELADVEHELGLWHTGGSGYVVIGALPVATPLLIPEALKALNLVAPRVTVQVIEGASDTMFSELLAGKIDMLVGRVWPGEEPDVMTDMLYDSTFRLYVRAEHPLAKRKRLTLKDAVEYPWILPPPSARTRGVIEDLFRQSGLNLPIHPVETSSYQVVRALMLESDVVVPLPIEVLFAEQKCGLVYSLPIRLDLRLPPIGIVRNSKRTVSPAALALIEQLKIIGERASSIYDL